MIMTCRSYVFLRLCFIFLSKEGHDKKITTCVCVRGFFCYELSFFFLYILYTVKISIFFMVIIYIIIINSCIFFFFKKNLSPLLLYLITII
uniref:Uncharacterized protein n=1 Tax=Rhizophagus irregularis (strain DAOM 181602 / DAOM 197198 / MUCL 43194) TaxID=747089 RepID=U9U9Y1_RHIID